MTRILIMGPPGSGKGTQAAKLAEACAIPAISTGEIFRANMRDHTSLGETARTYVDAGEYVPDPVTNAMVRERLGRDDCRTGFVLDGYPRTLDQVEALDRLLDDIGDRIDAVLVIDVVDDDLVERLVRRATIEQRADDTEEVIRHRQKVYAEQTAPLLEEYARRRLVRSVDGTGSVEGVTARIVAALGLDAGWVQPGRVSGTASAGTPGWSGRSSRGRTSRPR